MLQELKCQEDIFQAKEIQQEIQSLGFEFIYTNFANIKGYSGVAILSKIKPINTITKLNESELDNEGRFILLEFEKCFLINVYQPTSGEKLKFMDYRLKWDRHL